MPPVLINPQTGVVSVFIGGEWVVVDDAPIRQVNGRYEAQLQGQWVQGNTTNQSEDDLAEAMAPTTKGPQRDVQEARDLANRQVQQQSLLRRGVESALAGTGIGSGILLGKEALRGFPNLRIQPRNSASAQENPLAPHGEINDSYEPQADPLADDKKLWAELYPGIPFRTRENPRTFQQEADFATAERIQNRLDKNEKAKNPLKKSESEEKAQEGRLKYNERLQQGQLKEIQSPGDYYLLSQAMQQPSTGRGYDPNFRIARSPIAQQDTPVESSFLDQHPEYKSTAYADSHGRLPGTPYFGSPEATQTTFAPQGKGLDAYGLGDLARGQGGSGSPLRLPEGTPALLGPGQYHDLGPVGRELYAAEFQRQGIPRSLYEAEQEKVLKRFDMPRLSPLRRTPASIRGY